MIWRFSFIDRNNITTYIDEPVGWDATQLEISRDLDMHGVFFGNQGSNSDGNSYEFHKEAYFLLKKEYDTYGVQGYTLLVTEQSCNTIDWVVVDTSQFDFNQYEEDCAPSGCFVKVPAETNSGIMTLRNLIAQAVDLGATVAFDEVTPLETYSKLPFIMSLPSKGILLQDDCTNVLDNPTGMDGGLQPSRHNEGDTIDYNFTSSQMELGFNTSGASEFGSFSLPANALLTMVHENALEGGDDGDGFFYPDDEDASYTIYPLDASQLLNYSSDSLNFGQISNPCQLKYKIVGELEIKNTYLRQCVFFMFRLPDRPTNVNNGTLAADYELIKKVQYFDSRDTHAFVGISYSIIDGIPRGYAGTVGLLPGTAEDFQFLYPGGKIYINEQTSEDIVVATGDRFYCFFLLTEEKNNTQIAAGLAGGNPAFVYTMKDGSSFEISSLSTTPATDCKVYAINESISRVIEAITNNKMKLYSDYFGRTDSQPYAAEVDGEGSLEVITNGLRIRRQENMTPGVTNIYSVSLQDLLNGLNPIHNIGLGIEDDPERSGFSRVRIEPWKFFYTDDIIMRCVGVNKIITKVFSSEIYATFTFGYQTWEAEQYTGLDEFLTKRIYRTTLTQVSNDFSQISAMIASGYALEVTRRLSNSTTSDWRYDNNTFLICCRRNKQAGSSVTTDYNINDIIVFREIRGVQQMQFASPHAFLIIGNTFTLTSTSDDPEIDNNGTYKIIALLGTENDIVSVETISGGVTDQRLFTKNITSSVTVVIPPIDTDDLVVELGNVTSPENLLSPDTLYNYRISPVRNAMRWMNCVFESYKQINPDAKIIFTSGDGNYFAKGEMTDDYGRLENAPIQENETINNAIFADASQAAPFKTPERVTFTFPMSGQDYINIKASPKGLIYYDDQNTKSGYGWIDTIKYTPETGTANFTLIPKIT